jgi:hypothetical protein
VLKTSVRRLLLGGAAVYRCDQWPVLIAGFSHRGHDARGKSFSAICLATEVKMLDGKRFFSNPIGRLKSLVGLAT